jgi:hypothetical protein
VRAPLHRRLGQPAQRQQPLAVRIQPAAQLSPMVDQRLVRQLEPLGLGGDQPHIAA